MLGRNSQNKPYGFSIHVVLRSGAEIWNFQRLSGYELAGNEIFCAAWEQWGLGQLKCSMGRMERYKRDAYHVGKHPRPTPRLAHVIFFIYLFIY